jgi:acyl-CoA thioesterase-1
MIVGATAVVALSSCGRGAQQRVAASDSTAALGASVSADSTLGSPQSPTPNPRSRLITFLGTSLTAGLGLDASQAFPALIQRKLDSLHLPWRSENAGVSGETSAGAVRRLDWVLKDAPAILVVETGANDGLRGLDVDTTRANLEAIVRHARSVVPGIRIVLAGMEAPPNLGTRYTARFRAIFRDVAEREHLALIPFLLAGVGGVDSLNQADGIHPNVGGERIVAANVWRVLERLVRGGVGSPSPNLQSPIPVSR